MTLPSLSVLKLVYLHILKFFLILNMLPRCDVPEILSKLWKVQGPISLTDLTYIVNSSYFAQFHLAFPIHFENDRNEQDVTEIDNSCALLLGNRKFIAFI